MENNALIQNLEYLEETKELIKEAINSKGGAVSDSDTFRSYADKIKEIPMEKVEEDVTANPSTVTKVIYPTENYTCIREVKLEAVTSDIDSNIKPENIKKGVSILGVTGSVEEDNPNKYFSTDGIIGGNNNPAYFCGLNACLLVQPPNISIPDTNTSLQSAFANTKIKTIDITNLNFKNITNFNYTFSYNSELEEVIGLENKEFSSEPLDFTSTFVGCSKLKKIDFGNEGGIIYPRNIGTLALTDIFGRDSSLEVLNLSRFDFSECTSGLTCASMNLKEIHLGPNFGKGYKNIRQTNDLYTLNLRYCNLNKQQILDIFNNTLYDLNLTYDVAGGGTLVKQRVNIGSGYTSLTEEEKDIARNKGWMPNI